MAENKSSRVSVSAVDALRSLESKYSWDGLSSNAGAFPPPPVLALSESMSTPSPLSRKIVNTRRHTFESSLQAMQQAPPTNLQPVSTSTLSIDPPSQTLTPLPISSSAPSAASSNLLLTPGASPSSRRHRRLTMDSRADSRNHSAEPSASQSAEESLNPISATISPLSPASHHNGITADRREKDLLALIEQRECEIAALKARIHELQSRPSANSVRPASSSSHPSRPQSAISVFPEADSKLEQLRQRSRRPPRTPLQKPLNSTTKPSEPSWLWQHIILPIFLCFISGLLTVPAVLEWIISQVCWGVLCRSVFLMLALKGGPCIPQVLPLFKSTTETRSASSPPFRS